MVGKPGRTEADAKARHRFLLCSPDHFSVKYVINPWMEGNIERSDRSAAAEQWNHFRRVLSDAADIEAMTQPEGVPDLVFTANAGLVVGQRVVLSHFRHLERRREEPHFKKWFEENGFEVIEMPRGTYFEGAGDGLFLRDRDVLVLGYGFRTILESAAVVSDALGIEVVPVKLTDDRFYHLDTCFCPLTGGKLIWYPEAFDKRSVQTIMALVDEKDRHAVSEWDALHFACNAVDTGKTVILNDATPELEKRLSDWGFDVVRTPLNQFLLAGGAAKCLSLRLNESIDREKRGGAYKTTVSAQVEFRGHIVDDGTMSRVMDFIPSAAGSFSVMRFEPGFAHNDESYIRLGITAPDAARLSEILSQLVSLGAVVVAEELKAARLAQVTQQGVAPPDFYSTTIFPTEVHLGDRWIRVEKQRMDAVIVCEETSGGMRLVCRLLRDLRVGDRIVVGSTGIRVLTRREAEDGEFKFMSSAVSSERRVESAVEHIAWEMSRIRARRGRIVVVAGPVVIHTGGGPYLGKLIRDGYVGALLAGNALAVHDLESQLYGTSLGVDLKRGKAVSEGHRHHINTINMIRACGGIRQAVEQGAIKGGLFYDVVKAGVPYCLAGSIRDDGPLPETEMDLVKAQAEYARLLEGAEMILMLSSMLHSIGVGNMTPAGVRLICVDINPSVATKLADRGSVDSTPVVTDVGLFLNLLSRKLESASE